ncbi:hypothetical protein, partial [Vibrio splendidus]|uniref:hypothetical protein n=1 Tax=Vibrio splendidus TaxID=29497 RepID=UPI00114CFF35
MIRFLYPLFIYFLAFNVHASVLVRVINGGSNIPLCHSVFGSLSAGSVYDIDVLASIGKSKIGDYFSGYKLTGIASHSNRNPRISAYFNRGSCSLSVMKATCPPPNAPNEATGLCENVCKKMKDKSLGTVTFPEGTRDVASLCRNSCKAKSDLFFPAATPPYGVFTYTGDSCDGSESSGGETGGET